MYVPQWKPGNITYYICRWLLFLSLFSLDLLPDNFLRNLVCLLGHITLTKNSFKPQKAPYSRDEPVIETVASFDAVSLVYLQLQQWRLSGN